MDDLGSDAGEDSADCPLCIETEITWQLAQPARDRQTPLFWTDVAFAPDQANIREIFDDGQSALLFDPEKEESLGLAVERLSRDPDLRRRLGQAARQTIVDRRLTWDANARHVTQIASSLLNRRQGATLNNGS